MQRSRILFSCSPISSLLDIRILLSLSISRVCSDFHHITIHLKIFIRHEWVRHYPKHWWYYYTQPRLILLLHDVQTAVVIVYALIKLRLTHTFYKLNSYLLFHRNYSINYIYILHKSILNWKYKYMMYIKLCISIDR